MNMKIIPMRDLKNTVEVERQCKEEQGPIFVTKNGYGRLVVMDIEYYESTIQKMEEARLLIEALEDVEEGRVLDGKEALLKLREKYGI
jgi:prevent-host-death family protein